MEFLAIIPARYTSTRFPGKPLVDIEGKPMIRWVYERVVQCYAHTVVATDDSRIYDAVESFGGRVVMTDGHHRSGTDRCREALDEYERQSGRKYDVVVNVQGDEPLICPGHLAAVREVFEDSSVGIATLIKPFSINEDIFDPNKPKVIIGSDNNALYFSRTSIPYLRGVAKELWQGSHIYYKHIGLYGYRSEVLRLITTLPQGDLERAESLEQLRWIENGYRIRTVKTDVESVSVDTPEDLERVLESLSRM